MLMFSTIALVLMLGLKNIYTILLPRDHPFIFTDISIYPKTQHNEVQNSKYS